MNRTWVWLVVSPVVASGVLTAHSLAYRLTSTPSDPVHVYLEHAPQVLLVLVVTGVVLSGLAERLHVPSAGAFPLLGLATFVVQEHLERLVHGGALPFLFTSPAFLVGVLLQIPVGVVAWALARWLVAALRDSRPRRVLRGRHALLRVAQPSSSFDPIDVPISPGRGPPALLPSC